MVYFDFKDFYFIPSVNVDFNYKKICLDWAGIHIRIGWED